MLKLLGVTEGRRNQSCEVWGRPVLKALAWLPVGSDFTEMDSMRNVPCASC